MANKPQTQPNITIAQTIKYKFQYYKQTHLKLSISKQPLPHSLTIIEDESMNLLPIYTPIHIHITSWIDHPPTLRPLGSLTNQPH